MRILVFKYGIDLGILSYILVNKHPVQDWKGYYALINKNNVQWSILFYPHTVHYYKSDELEKESKQQ